jgi:hypothetical protein
VKIATATPEDFSDRFTVVVDPDATPVNWDAAVVRFLIKYIERQSADTPAAGLSIYNPGKIED